MRGLTPGEREQRVLENLEAWAARGDEEIRLIARILVARLLPGPMVQPLVVPAPSVIARRGKWWRL